MQQFKHYSFDMWGTLIKPNPEYKQKRGEYFVEHLKRKSAIIDIESVDPVMLDVWEYFDKCSKLFGRAPNPLEMYAMVVFRLTGSLENVTPLDISLMYRDLERIFLKYHPTLYDDDTARVIQELYERGNTLSILSNTSFIKGNTLSQVLDKLDVGKFFSFQGYSDEIGFSKPHHNVFRYVDEMVKMRFGHEVEDVIHIGDKELEDGQGAYEYGFGHMVINSNSYTIKDLL